MTTFNSMRSHPSVLVVLSVLFVLSSSVRAEEKAADGAVHVNVEAAAKLVQEKKVTVLDVRTADEFGEGHIAGATNVDFLQSAEFEAAIGKLDKSKPYLVHCQAGGRSARSLKLFKKLGFETIYHLDDGFGGWHAAGKPVVK